MTSEMWRDFEHDSEMEFLVNDSMAHLNNPRLNGEINRFRGKTEVLAHAAEDFRGSAGADDGGAGRDGAYGGRVDDVQEEVGAGRRVRGVIPPQQASLPPGSHCREGTPRATNTRTGRNADPR